MNDLIIKQTHALIQAGEIAEAEANLAVIAEQEGDHALVEVLDEMAPKDVLAVMREFDTSKESIIDSRKPNSLCFSRTRFFSTSRPSESELRSSISAA